MRFDCDIPYFRVARYDFATSGDASSLVSVTEWKNLQCTRLRQAQILVPNKKVQL